MKQHEILKTIFGHDEFLSIQSSVIGSVLAGKDTLAVMPTGAGKSLCYQIPALVFDGLTVIVSPLISLMKDQVDQLSKLNIPAALLNSALLVKPYRENIAKLKSGKTKMLYVAPETFLKPDILELLSLASVNCIAVDEAHCISKWGHDFRPSYRRISQARKLFKNAVCIALTATATEQVRFDIQKNLEFVKENEFIASFDRPNLLIRITGKWNPVNQTESIIRNNDGSSGIIYCSSRKTTEYVSRALCEVGLSAIPYHAGMKAKDRAKNQELFMGGEIKIIVATTAFGMGIDKPNIRFVIHYDLPQSIEGYYQEIGRAGRDGLFSDCTMLFSSSDVSKIKWAIQFKKDHAQKLANIHLRDLLQFIKSGSCRRKLLLKYFGERYLQENCQMCDNCLMAIKANTNKSINRKRS